MADPIGVDDAVEKMLGGKPPTEEVEQDESSAEAAAKAASDKGEQATGDSEESAELTAFEQELIAELEEDEKTAFESGTPEYRKQALAFMKKQYRRNAKSMTELGTLRKAVGALRDAGVTNEDLVKLVQEKQGSTKADAQRVVRQAPGTDGKRGYQRWLDDAKTPEQREALQDARQVLLEEFEDFIGERFEKRVKPIEDRLNLSDREAMTERAQSMEAEINALEDDLGYPGSLIETYRQQMIQEGIRYPKLEAEDLLVRVAGFKTVKAAMLKAQAGKGESKEGEEGAKPYAKPGSTIIKKPAQGGGIELPRKRTGSISISSALDLLMRPRK